MDEEFEIIMITFEDFKNDIISKNDKIKSKDEYWWANLKNDLLFYSNTLQGEKRDLVNILLANIIQKYINIMTTNATLSPIEKLKRVDRQSINLGLSNQDFIDFLSVLIKYVKTTSKFMEDVEILNVEAVPGIALRESIKDPISALEYLSRLAESRGRLDISILYNDFFPQSLLTLEFIVANAYIGNMGRLQNPQLGCFDIKPVNPNQENNKIDEKVAKFIDLENKKMFLIQELNKLNKDIADSEYLVNNYKQEIQEINYSYSRKHTGSDIDLFKRKDKLIEKIKDENSYTTIEKKRIEEMKTEVRELNKKTSILIPEYNNKSRIEGAYLSVESKITDMIDLGIDGTSLNRFGDPWLSGSLFEMLLNMKETLDSILYSSLIFYSRFNSSRNEFYKELFDDLKTRELAILGMNTPDDIETPIIGYTDTRKIKDKYLVNQIMLYQKLLSAFIGDYKSLEKYNEDLDGRKVKGLDDVNKYDKLIEFVVCIDKHIKELKTQLEPSPDKLEPSTRLKYLYQPGEQRLLQDSSEEIEDLGDIYLEKKRRVTLIDNLTRSLADSGRELFTNYPTQIGDKVMFREYADNGLRDLYNKMMKKDIDSDSLSDVSSISSMESVDISEFANEADDYGGGKLIGGDPDDEYLKDHGVGVITNITKRDSPTNPNNYWAEISYDSFDKIRDESGKRYIKVKKIAERPITELVKIDSIKIGATVDYNNWKIDKYFIDLNREFPFLINNDIVYKFDKLYPWPCEPECKNTSIGCMDYWDSKKHMDKAVEQIKQIYNIPHTERKKILTEAIDRIYTRESFSDLWRDSMLELLEVEGKEEEVVIELYLSDKRLVDMLSFGLPGLKDTIVKSDILNILDLTDFTVGGEGELVDIYIPPEPFNTLNYGIAYIKIKPSDDDDIKSIIIQRLVRHLHFFKRKTDLLNDRKELQTEMKKIEDIKNDMISAMETGEPTQYIKNPYRKNKDIYNEQLEKLGLGDIFERIEREQTAFKDKEYKMLQLAKEKAKTFQRDKDKQELSLAPEYRKWIKNLKKIDDKGLTVDVGAYDLDPGATPEEILYEEPENIAMNRMRPQPTEAEEDWFSRLGITKDEALENRRKVFSLLEDRYRPLTSRFIGRQDLRRDILSRRSNSDEGLGEQIERRRRMEELTNRIDRERENRIRDIETQIRLQGRVSSESEEDPYGLENMFNLDTI